jgi:hypothetical protein
MFNFFRRKAKLMDFTEFDGFQAGAFGPDFSKMGDYGPSVSIDEAPEVGFRHTNRYGEWFGLGEKAWKVLEKKRIKEIFSDCDDCEGFSEFLLYWDLIGRSSPRYRNEVFVGLGPSPEVPAPVFVPRSTFDGHAYILGKPDRGKTSQALTTLLLQLARPVNEGGKPPAILIIDLKPQGDRFLRAVAELIARQRGGEELRFFSNASLYQSLLFDPWSVIASEGDLQARAEMIFHALSLIHPESQEAVFFMNEQRYVLEKALSTNPRSLRELITRLDQMTRGKSGNPEARGVHGALSILENSTNVIVDEPQPGREDIIDFRALLDKGEVLYVHLETGKKLPASQAVGKLLLSCLLSVATRRREDDRLEPAKAYVAIDEFHRLAAQSVLSFLETSRDLGVSFILSHQTPKSYGSADVDLFRLLFDITSFQQYLTLTSDTAIELLRLVSSRRSEFLRQKNRSTSESRSTSTGWSDQASSGSSGEYGLFGLDGADRWSTSRAHSTSGGTTEGQVRQRAKGKNEAKIPGLTPEMVARVNDPGDLVSLIVSSGREDSGLSPLHGLPTLVERIFPFSKKRAESLRTEAWPPRKTKDPQGEKDGPQRPRYLPGPKGGRRTKSEAFNKAAEDLFNAAGGKHSQAPRPKKPKKTKGSEEPFV